MDRPRSRLLTIFLTACALWGGVPVSAQNGESDLVILPGPVRLDSDRDGFESTVRRPDNRFAAARHLTPARFRRLNDSPRDCGGGFEPMAKGFVDSSDVSSFGELKTVAERHSYRAGESHGILPVSGIRTDSAGNRGRPACRADLRASDLGAQQSFAPARNDLVPRSDRQQSFAPHRDATKSISEQPQPGGSQRPVLQDRAAQIEVATQEYSVWNPRAAEERIANEIQWYADLHMARLSAVQSRRPLLLSIVADECPHCARLDQSVFGDSKVVETITGEFVPVRLNVEQPADRRVAELLGINRIPTTLVLSPEADLIGRFVGAFEPGQFLDCLAEAVEDNAGFGQVVPAGATAPRREHGHR